ncbi:MULTISPECIES: PIG-L family deacetylase [unclassified Mucilaginibacter]|uniref:PIG-L family deacetylase n=1 Tax=unclassified Mucilaginibacter TaxID=2617802 RepID=UPI002AC960CA|nr:MULTISPECIES: PIG-L family deacetylase [unclassified Mucilaginibacter]MEB0264070.1 PIG-L family deacetylase [Mucilaginibacter sp. 10I4]MEB0280226.1 PIG-L family deacetylase [Mucilaginibacter sp. 10B2]MEB0301151.1 PIG-L family deacetylase [Mucilaginibacter sp. 5C4]WPX24365.1 PIG-L family deacetylase [Mucilaginibacter sp. 5C4]
MKRILPVTLILFFAYAKVFSQTAPPSDIGTIQQNLKKLKVLGSVLYIAAHPDDENTRLLGYLAQEKHYRTGYLSLTRGDGGQNLIGTEQGELLGLIRTQELLAARRMDGAEQFFSRANDFGFSKNPEETLKFWDKDKVLGDMVWVIRNFRPDVMICRFPTTGEGGHGNHTASAILAQEAFSAAADPKRYPEQLKYTTTWQAKRLLWNTFNFGSTNTTSPDQFKINVGGYNPILGKSYGEIAAESRSNHKTQGFGSAKQRGDAFEYFKTILGDAPKTDLMDGVDVTWTRTPFGTPIAQKITAITKAFNSDAPQASVPALVALLGDVDQTVATNKAFQTVRLTEGASTAYNYWHKQKTKELKDIIAACAGLWFEAYTAEPAYAVGDTMKIQLQGINSSDVPVTLFGITITDTFITYADSVFKKNQLKTLSQKFAAKKLTQPYWLESPHGIGNYTINDDLKVGNPENPDAQMVRVDFNIAGRTINYYRKLVFKYVDPTRGEIYQPLEITPPVTANIAEKLYAFNNTQPQTVQIKLKSFTNAAGSISLKPLAGWKISPAKIDYTGKNKGDEWTVAFTVSPTDSKTNTAVLQADVIANGKTFSQGLLDIRYNHVPAITIFPPAQAKLVNIDLKTAGKKIGYIAGAGDLIPESLREVGYDVHILTESEIINGDLSVYDAIVTGVRAYNVNERLAYGQPKLMEYVKNGGNLVVQYNNNNGLVTRNISPYPFTVVNQRVTEEDAKVIFAEPTSPVLNYPNKITNADFNDWIQERGLYFVDNIDSQYSTPLQMNDTGMAPNKGSLIVTNLGKGRFVYTSLAFFRELPAGVPGAYRLFVNLLSKPKN